jgi:oxygen-independent coproporphyrinogen-3 oxidase
MPEPAGRSADEVSGLYVHVPFCAADCAYCAFAREVPGSRADVGRYLDALALEVEHWIRELGGEIRPRTLYVGGGTPTFLRPDEWSRFAAILGRFVRRDRTVEVTVEANPESLTPNRLPMLEAFGVTRLSLGAQSTHAEHLALLGRTHDWRAVETAVERARAIPEVALSLDLIYGIPGLSLDAWEETLDRTLAMVPDHLSAYCLSYEEGTSLTRRRGRGELVPQTDDLQRAQYDTLVARARGAGLDRYEVSNFGTPRGRSHHNLGYWRGSPYLGLGPSAHSQLGDRRFWNHSRRLRWDESLAAGQGPVKGIEVLGPDERRVELLMRLRLDEGIALVELPAGGAVALRLAQLEEEGLVVRSGGRLRVTDAGAFLSDGIAADLLAVWEDAGLEGGGERCAWPSSTTG